MSTDVKVATWNVNGIRKRYGELCRFVEDDAPDIFCLQEIKASPDQVPDTLTGLPEYWNVWHGGPKGYSGVSLHVRRQTHPAPPHVFHPAFDMENRIVVADLGDLVVMSVYVPNGGKDYPAKLHFLEQLAAYVSALRSEGRNVLVCGDLNVAHLPFDVHPKLQKAGQIGTRPEERALFDGLLQPDMVDIARTFAPEDEALFTWWPPWRELRKKNVGWRIDYVLASPALANAARSFVVLKDVGTSDHAPVVVEFD